MWLVCHIYHDLLIFCYQDLRSGNAKMNLSIHRLCQQSNTHCYVRWKGYPETWVTIWSGHKRDRSMSGEKRYRVIHPEFGTRFWRIHIRTSDKFKKIKIFCMTLQCYVDIYNQLIIKINYKNRFCGKWCCFTLFRPPADLTGGATSYGWGICSVPKIESSCRLSVSHRIRN